MLPVVQLEVLIFFDLGRCLVMIVSALVSMVRIMTNTSSFFFIFLQDCVLYFIQCVYDVDIQLSHQHFGGHPGGQLL